MIPEKIDWTRAVQGGLFYVVGLFAICGVLYIALSYGIFIITELNAQLLAAGILHTSQQRTNTLNLGLDFWYVIPIVIGIIALVYLIKYGLESDESGDAY